MGNLDHVNKHVHVPNSRLKRKERTSRQSPHRACHLTSFHIFTCRNRRHPILTPSVEIEENKSIALKKRQDLLDNRECLWPHASLQSGSARQRHTPNCALDAEC